MRLPIGSLPPGRAGGWGWGEDRRGVGSGYALSSIFGVRRSRMKNSQKKGRRPGFRFTSTTARGLDAGAARENPWAAGAAVGIAACACTANPNRASKARVLVAGDAHGLVELAAPQKVEGLPVQT